MKKRKEFNTLKQRIVGEDHQQILDQVQSKHAYYENAKLNKKWKLQSAQFRAAVTGGKSGKPVEEVADDRVECEFCNRKFASESAARHIPLCQKKSIDKMHKEKSQALTKKNSKPSHKITY